ncbi:MULTISPECIES: response regulator transcription factor [unclassified Sphingomonas]|uniref:response regulator transcription factor n=1 Tax=unclassified Sphingomonas TaxID=196159 RepID=UPI0006F235AA|nr:MULTISPECIES: response regulator [unclassified Sphingomonas]KQN29317.1 two-component system response regulator [Sphingomonas sp. Leaf38]KQN31490.1 two-component system response regulator [Sphingomonas sp. Leaf34]
MIASTAEPATVYVLDDDIDLGASVARLLARHGHAARAFAEPAALLRDYTSGHAACIISDVMMGDMDGFTFADALRDLDPDVALVFMTAWPTTANAVDSVRRYGGLDYLEKPIDEDRLLIAVAEGVAWSNRRRLLSRRTATLTTRERQVFDLLVCGHSNKAIAGALGLSIKTIENHRAAIVTKTGTNGLAQLIALVS